MRANCTGVRALTNAGLSEGVHELCARDRDLDRVRKKLGEPPLWARRPGFPALVRIILEQQVSLAAARTMYRRLFTHFGGMSPAGLHAAGEAGLRKLGLTRQKARYCHDIAARVMDGRLDLAAVAALPDADGRSILLSVPGLGPWSVDIYYLMALRRPDVWPEGDLALASALRDVKRMKALPTKDEQQVLAARWSPLKSVAARILWAHYLAARGQYVPR
jgi:DNA-3-methyladenine glycosylase II